MKGQQAKALALACCAAQLASHSQAFTAPPSLPLSQKPQSGLHLLPDQGNQLVAAYNAISIEKNDSKEETTTNGVENATNIEVDKNVEGNHQRGAIAASKSFLARVFHLPSARHPGEDVGDVVYYPMVGFRFFEGIDTVFPTTSHVSCVMPTKSQKEEEVFGWFSPSCQLDLFSEDICQNPIGYDDEECIMQ